MQTVLVVDDDVVMRRLISLVLSSENIEVQRAQGGEEALSLLGSSACEPALVLLDLSMPGMDGRETFKRARQAGYGGPVIFCSAHGAEEANRELGAQGAIKKPFDPEFLVATVRSHLKSA